MAELLPNARLQPSLLDRLTDLEPDRTTEARDKRVLSNAQLRRSVQRDLAWLLNAVRLSAIVDLSPYSEVEHSVLNFGFPDLAGRTVTSLDVPALQRAVRQIIWDFEPRLLRDTVRVSPARQSGQDGHNKLCFDVEANLWSEPIPVRLYLRTDIDLEDGQVRVSDVGGGSAG